MFNSQSIVAADPLLSLLSPVRRIVLECLVEATERHAADGDTTPRREVVRAELQRLSASHELSDVRQEAWRQLTLLGMIKS